MSRNKSDINAWELLVRYVESEGGTHGTIPVNSAKVASVLGMSRQTTWALVKAAKKKITEECGDEKELNSGPADMSSPNSTKKRKQDDEQVEDDAEGNPKKTKKRAKPPSKGSKKAKGGVKDEEEQIVVKQECND